MIWGFRGACSPWGSFLLAACKKAQSDSLSRGTPMVGECRLTQTFPAKSGLYQRGLQVDCLKAEHPLFLFAPWMRRLLSACPPLYFSPILAEAFGVQYADMTQLKIAPPTWTISQLWAALQTNLVSHRSSWGDKLLAIICGNNHVNAENCLLDSSLTHPQEKLSSHLKPRIYSPLQRDCC